MPPAPPKSSMSPGELAICEDFLDSHREYAIDLLSNIKKIYQWHKPNSCPETRDGRTCMFCEFCSTDGLMGATARALVSYDDAGKHLKAVRASLGKSVPSRGTSSYYSSPSLDISSRAGEPSRETLFRNGLAKTVFLSIVTTGDTLRSQHATWQARLQSEVATSSLSAEGLQHTNTVPGEVLLPTYSGPKVVGPETNPKISAVATGSVPKTTPSSSMFVVFRRCLSSDCPCEANKASAASNTNLRVACGSQVTSKVPLTSSDSKKTRTSKVTAKSETATRGGGNRAARSTTTNLERRSRKTNDTSDALAKGKTNAQTQNPSMCHDLNSPDTRTLDAQRTEEVILAGHAPSSPTLATALCTQETESSSSSPELIVDPRIFLFGAQIVRSDDARRALMEWCRSRRADLQLDPREGRGTGLEAALTRESTLEGRRGYPSALARDLETVKPGRSESPCMASQVGEADTKDLSHGDEVTTQELRFNSEQEELKGRWLMARQKRCKGRKRRPSGLELY